MPVIDWCSMALHRKRIMTENSIPNLGYRIRLAMFEKGIKQQDLASQIHISRTSLSSIMRGKTKDPGFSIICQIAKALDVSLDYLAGNSDEFKDNKL